MRVAEMWEYDKGKREKTLTVPDIPSESAWLFSLSCWNICDWWEGTKPKAKGGKKSHRNYENFNRKCNTFSSCVLRCVCRCLFITDWPPQRAVGPSWRKTVQKAADIQTRALNVLPKVWSPEDYLKTLEESLPKRGCSVLKNKDGRAKLTFKLVRNEKNSGFAPLTVFSCMFALLVSIS